MRTIRIKLYKFSELNEDAKQKAIEKFSDINVDYDWWKSIYEDAAQIGLKLTSFDLDRNRHAKGEFIISAIECSEAIIKNHGEMCETYKTAQKFIAAMDLLPELPEEDADNYAEMEDNNCNATDELEEEFLNSLLEDYSIMLQKECEYLTTDEAIIETIEANDYEFTKDGKLA